MSKSVNIVDGNDLPEEIVPIKFREKGWDNIERYTQIKNYDNRKKEYYKKNNIHLYEITYLDDIENKLKEIITVEGR